MQTINTTILESHREWLRENGYTVSSALSHGVRCLQEKENLMAHMHKNEFDQMKSDMMGFNLVRKHIEKRLIIIEELIKNGKTNFIKDYNNRRECDVESTNNNNDKKDHIE